VRLVLTAAGMFVNWASRLSVASPMAERTLAAVKIASPTPLPTGTPNATDAVAGTARVPVFSLLGP